ncbi:MAG: dihydroorotate dehydrogenase electron transfer subunit [Lachnospiraceae bacterium]|nr:dihydroorotate dehydrogenase electron transfer subunit [Lachnospiraceae bacterium]
MKQSIFTITENKRIATDVYSMRLCGDTSAVTAPGQFVNIRLDGLFLRRPISVCDCVDGELWLVYKVVGHGTEQMACMQPGQELDVLTGLGNGYDISSAGDAPLLVGGGVGTPPLLLLAKSLRAQGKKVSAVLGFNTAREIILKDDLEALGCGVSIATMDGSAGTKGFVTDALPAEASYIFACGPEPMLRAVYRATACPAQFSFEERMGCGFGACMGCSCRTVTGYKRICTDGPVLRREEILWQI